MIDRKTIALINGEVDGTNSTEESEALRRTLAQDPEAQKLLSDLKKLERSLHSIPSVEPPQGLKSSVMRHISARRVSSRPSEHRSGLIDFLFPARSLPRLGFAFSGGVLAGIALVVLYFSVVSHPSSIDDRDASGTILGSSEAFQTAGDEAIAADGVQGKVVSEFSNTLSVLRVNLTMQPGLTARFVFNAEGAKLKGVSAAEQFQGTLMQSDGLLEVGHGGGSFKAFFAPTSSAAQDVRFQVVSGENVLYERSIPLRKGQ
jgi:hypothetical protein